jgi:SAM-dependent methyltransferase
VHPIEADFPENSYGIVKRLRVIGEWLGTEDRPLRILDFGCGTGEQITAPLARAGHVVIGVDVHAPTIAEARRRFQLPALEFRSVKPDEFPEKPWDFDAIVCSEVIEHLDHPERLLLKFRRALRSDGVLIVTTPNGRGSYELLCALERFLTKTGIHGVFRRILPAGKSEPNSSPGFLNHESGHVQFFRLSILEELFRQSGFQVVDRRARTFLCGPYADLLFNGLPFRRATIRWNAKIAEVLPMSCVADWMFLLRKS